MTLVFSPAGGRALALRDKAGEHHPEEDSIVVGKEGLGKNCARTNNRAPTP